MQPVIFYENKYKSDDIEGFKKNNKIWKIVDIYKRQLKELFEIRNPALLKSPDYDSRLEEYASTKKRESNQGDWVYFPWNGIFIHMVPDSEYFELRTNRNRNLITAEEQKKLYNSTIGIVGLSVGANTATAITYQGISSNIKLADFDDLSTSNLNRIKASVADIGEEKINIASKQIYEINPYANLSLFREGLNDDTLDQFINSSPKPQVIFELIDDFKMKIKLRLAAKKAGIPVIMLTNLGDSVLVDIERFDLNPSLKLFNELLGSIPEEILKDENLDTKKYAMQIVGKDNIPPRAIESLSEIGSTLVGRPQLFSTLSVSSGIGAYLAREIILGRNLRSGRHRLALDALISIESI